MHDETGQPIHFLNRLLMGVVLQKKTRIKCHTLCHPNEAKIFLNCGDALLLCCCNFANFIVLFKKNAVIMPLKTVTDSVMFQKPYKSPGNPGHSSSPYYI